MAFLRQLFWTMDPNIPHNSLENSQPNTSLNTLQVAQGILKEMERQREVYK